MRIHGCLATSSIIRIPIELQVSQSHCEYEYPVGSDLLGRLKAGCPTRRHDVILLHAIATDPEAPDQLAVLIERHAPREEDHTIDVEKVAIVESL